MVRVGIIGFGKMGRIRYDSLLQSGRAQVVALTDSQPIADPPLGAKLYASGEELIRDAAIDAVFIATPNHLNSPLTILALNAGKHVFCEKPPAFTAEDMENVIRAETASGKKLMYGFNHRHHDSVIKAKSLIDSGEHGRILWMRGRYGKSVDKNFFTNWRAKKELAGGGIMMDQGIHMLDLFLMFGGDFDEVMSAVSSLYWKLDVEDNVFAIFRNRDGLVASLHSTMTQWRHLFSLEIFLEKGYLVINGLLTSSGTYGEEVLTIARNRTTAPAATWDDEEHIRFELNTSWNSEVGQFLDAVTNGSPILAGTSQDALKLMRVMDKVYQGARLPSRT